MPVYWDCSFQLAKQRWLQLQNLHHIVLVKKATSYVFDAAKPKNSEDISANFSHKSSLSAKKCDPKHKDCLLREFRKLCAMVAEKPSYNVKTQIIQDFLKKGSGGGMIPAWHSQRIKALSKSISKYYFKSKGEIKSDCSVVQAVCCDDF